MQVKYTLINTLQLKPENVLAQIESIIAKYPYFELAHLAKAIETKDPISIHNANLFIDNPLWLQYLMVEQKQPTEDTDKILITQEVAPSNDKALENNEENVIPTSIFTEIEKETESESPNLLIENEAAMILQDEVETVTQQATTEEDFSLKIDEQAIANFKDPLQKPVDELLQVPIEPYHTIDYFASQGIKLSATTNPADKLGVQLKSFTDWLKTMRKVDTNSIDNELIVDDSVNSNVVSLAENSLVKNDILTENMVDVLLKQGKTNEAISLLEKLSLQDTLKSSYFASRIEQIKTN